MMAAAIERLRVLWLGLLALIIALTLLLLATLAERHMQRQLGALKALLGDDLVVVQLTRPIPLDGLNNVTLRLNAYYIAALSPSYTGKSGANVRAIYGDINAIDRHWLSEGRWPDAGDRISPIGVMVYAGSQPLRLGDWQRVGSGQYKVIGMVNQKVAGFIFGEVGRDVLLLPMEQLTPSQRMAHTLLLRPRDEAMESESSLRQYFAGLKHAVERIISPTDMIDQGSAVHAQLTRTLWVISLISSALAFIGVWVMLVRDVRDRTREIGLRRALGATPGHIARMIMSEVTLVVISATLIALLLVLLIRMVYPVEWLRGPLMGMSNWSMLLGLLLLTTVLALMPAIRAARISPMQALR